MNYTAREVPYTRVIEHKHFQFGAQEKTVLTWEYPSPWQRGRSPIIPSTTKRTRLCWPGIRSWPAPGRRCSSAAAWAATAITTWTRSSAPPWTPQPKSWPDLPQRVGSPSCKWLGNVAIIEKHERVPTRTALRTISSVGQSSRLITDSAGVPSPDGPPANHRTQRAVVLFAVKPAMLVADFRPP